jgi:hypothetical protein
MPAKRKRKRSLKTIHKELKRAWSLLEGKASRVHSPANLVLRKKLLDKITKLQLEESRATGLPMSYFGLRE